MGIDSAVFGSIMLDQKAQSFLLCNQRWLPNQVYATPTTMNYIERDQSGVETTLGLDSAPMFFQSADVGHGSTARLPSENRSISTDSANDPTPDGHGMEYSNEYCNSPESVCSSATETSERNRYQSMGTPNSFIDGNLQDPCSPEMFFGNRDRLFSTSSSTYGYSPYNPKERGDEFLPDNFANGNGSYSAPPCLNRQTSLAMVEEVLGPCSDMVYYTRVEDLSQTQTQLSPEGATILDDEDSCLPPYPSPSFSAHFNASTENALALSSSQEKFLVEFCAIERPEGLQCDGSPATPAEATQSLSRSNSNNSCDNREDDTTNSNHQTSPTQQDTTTVPADFSHQTCPVMLSKSSTEIQELLTDSIPTSSLDMYEMMQDCLEGLPKPEAEAVAEIGAIEIIEITPPEPPTHTLLAAELLKMPEPLIRPKISARRNSRKPPSPRISSKINAEESPSTSKECDIDSSRRERNNAACRESRKRRKNKKLELDELMQHYSEENRLLETQIEELVVECKRVRESIIGSMTNRQ